MTDLELATTDELVAELLRRKTFSGVVIRTESRGAWTTGTKSFKLSYAGLSRDEAAAILTHLSAHLETMPESDA